MSLRRAVVAAMGHDRAAPLFAPFVRGRVAVLMFHRFASQLGGNAGHDAQVLRDDLAWLRRRRVHVASLRDLLQPDGLPPDRLSVVLTVDDGYQDFADAGAPVFAEFDCPVCVFVVTGAVEQRLWFWWDRVEYALDHTPRRALTLPFETGERRWSWSDATTRDLARGAIVDALKGVTGHERQSALGQLGAALDVELPASPPAHFAAMTWPEIRRWASQGVTFAPHSVTHPMLPGESDTAAAQEMLESWTQLKREVDEAVPVFCYPNGAFTRRDVKILASSELRGAVTTTPGYSARDVLAATDPDIRYRVPRFAYNGDRGQLAQIVGGFERLKMMVRRSPAS